MMSKKIAQLSTFFKINPNKQFIFDLLILIILLYVEQQVLSFFYSHL
jgi:hypothetical protein